jgi:hypothetical protein
LDGHDNGNNRDDKGMDVLTALATSKALATPLSAVWPAHFALTSSVVDHKPALIFASAGFRYSQMG